MPEVKISLLRSLEEVSNSVKSQNLQPALNDLVADNTFVRIQNTFGESCEEFVALIVASIDGSSCTNLNAKDDAFWNMYLAVLRRFFHSGESVTMSAEFELIFCRDDAFGQASLNTETTVHYILCSPTGTQGATV